MPADNKAGNQSLGRRGSLQVAHRHMRVDGGDLHIADAEAGGDVARPCALHECAHDEAAFDGGQRNDGGLGLSTLTILHISFLSLFFLLGLPAMVEVVLWSYYNIFRLNVKSYFSLFSSL